jgi:protein-disulfide isomerase
VDAEGRTVTYRQARGTVTVVLFVSTKCPISNAYHDRMNALYREYQPKGVSFLYVNANSNEPAAEVERHRQEAALAFPVYKDPGNVAADRFGAQATPEVFVMDGENVIRYHGSIDDVQNEARVRVQGLRLALEALLAGRPVERKETKAFGCTIKRVRKLS